ncbi:MAG: glycosyltransferase family 2 protein [Anaerolineales bacterium]|nr:glycosyltransferase family 2 protein [Anaerolineales bacterium]
MSRLTVSVIIPTYNRAALLRATLDSVLAQTRVPDEIIVVNDGSTDETPQVLAQFSAPVKVIAQQNMGRSMARNRGLDVARGELIAFLDSDDLLLPNSIARRAEILETMPHIGVVHSDVQLIGQAGQLCGLFSQVYPVPRPSGMVFPHLICRNFVALSSLMFRRTPATQTLRFDPVVEPAEDYDFWVRLAPHCRFLYLAEALASYRLASDVPVTGPAWGLEGASAQADLQRVKESEVAVQERVMAMPAFLQLSHLQRARFYCAHGMKTMHLSKKPYAQRMFLNAIREAPYYPTGYTLLLLSAVGPGVFEKVISLRRRAIRLIADRFGFRGSKP